MSNLYLPLTEYSSKYRVSISTLRRRIKNEDIQFLFEEGKYLILDKPMSTHPKFHRPSPKMSEEALVSAHSGIHESPTQTPQFHAYANELNRDEPVLSAANRLLTELKKAYSHILQEKEEQILHLREEISDLKTLVRVLESENERLNLGTRRPADHSAY